MYISCHDPAGYTGNWQCRVILIVNAVLCSVGPWMSQILFDQLHSTQLWALRRAPWRSSIKELHQLCVQGKLDFCLCVHIKGGCYKKDYCFFSGHFLQGRKHFTDSLVHLVPSLQALPPTQTPLCFPICEHLLSQQANKKVAMLRTSKYLVYINLWNWSTKWFACQ
jgi:hypothetical protein